MNKLPPSSNRVQPKQPADGSMVHVDTATERLALARQWVTGAAESLRLDPAMVDHVRGVAAILAELGADTSAQAAAWLYPFDKAIDLAEIRQRFGPQIGDICGSMRQLRMLREIHQQSDARDRGAAAHLETLRRMLLAMSVDLRVVLLRLASRLQNLRHHAATRTQPDTALCHETIDVLAPLANRLGLWQLKWELEDLAFRFLEPEHYYELAGKLTLKRHERQELVRRASRELTDLLGVAGVNAKISGRPKHILSIWRKMQAKSLPFEQVQDLLALRVLVASIEDCYLAIDAIHQHWSPVADEYTDYISRPKANGYQSLHSVVRTPSGARIEVQVRTVAMHDAAEYGDAAHWQYKEGAAAPSDDTRYENRIAWLRQLLDWQKEVGDALGTGDSQAAIRDDHIYVMTPQARVIALPDGATPVDFAYHLHTELGHRCRGARVNGRMVPLSTKLHTGQTVEIVSARSDDTGDRARSGPSRDWLNPSLGFIGSRRARSKVRQWFAGQEADRERASGRAIVERILQRAGQTRLSLDALAERLGFDSAATMYAAVAHGDLGPRAIETAATGQRTVPGPQPVTAPVPPAQPGERATVLVEGDSTLVTSLAGCCQPVAGDEICGFISLGRGIRVHRADCSVLRRLQLKTPDRILRASWRTDAKVARGRGQRRR